MKILKALGMVVLGISGLLFSIGAITKLIKWSIMYVEWVWNY